MIQRQVYIQEETNILNFKILITIILNLLTCYEKSRMCQDSKVNGGQNKLSKSNDPKVELVLGKSLVAVHNNKADVNDETVNIIFQQVTRKDETDIILNRSLMSL